MKKLLLLTACFVFALNGFTQVQADRARMERERQDIQKQIQELQQNYNQVKGRTKATLGQLNILRRKLELQDRYISNINHEISILSNDIFLSNQEITRLQRQMDTLKQQYAKSVVYAYQNTNSYDYLNFIFSSVNFNDALKRLAYLKSYRAYRQQQAQTILETQKLIQDRKQQLLGKQSQKKSALQNQQQQMNVLAEQKKEKDAVVNKLKAQEKDLSKELAVKKKRYKQLQNQIAAVIRREIEKAKREEEARVAAARKKEAESRPTESAPSTPAKTTAAPKKTESYLTLNEGQRTLAASFEKNRGSLPWPVDNGYVSIPFGTSRVGGISIDNPCITISTPSAGGSVKAVFDGEVSSVSNLGDAMMVMIRHGKYFTVYSNLSSANVSVGSAVRTGQTIGRAGEADDGSGGQLDFYLMIEKNNVNPQPWLRR